MKVAHTREEMLKILSEYYQKEVTDFSLIQPKKNKKVKIKEETNQSADEDDSLIIPDQQFDDVLIARTTKSSQTLLG